MSAEQLEAAVAELERHAAALERAALAAAQRAGHAASFALRHPRPVITGEEHQRLLVQPQALQAFNDRPGWVGRV